jgi:hypothetical protein
MTPETKASIDEWKALMREFGCATDDWRRAPRSV